MNAKVKVFGLITLGYAVLGPVIGGLIVGTVYAAAIFLFGVEQMGMTPAVRLQLAFAWIIISYMAGLLPALASGLYVARKIALQKVIHLRTYYLLAASLSIVFALIPIVVLAESPEMEGKVVMVFFIVTPILAGWLTASLMLKLLRRFVPASFPLLFNRLLVEA